MIETKDVLTRHEVIGLLEDAIFAAKQYWGRECYLADQLSMLAYRIAEGEAGFVEDKGKDVFVGTEIRIMETVKRFIDMFEETTTEVVGLSFNKLRLKGLNEEWPEHYIKLSVAHQPNGKQSREGEREEGMEKEEDVVGTTLDVYDGVVEGMIAPSYFNDLVAEDLSDEEVKSIIRWAWHCRKESEKNKKERNQKYHHIPGPLYNGSDNKPNSDIQIGDLYPWPPEDSDIRKEEGKSKPKQPRSNSEGPEVSSDDELRTLLRDIVNNSTNDALNPTPKKVKNTIETIIDGLQKGILALSLMVELFSEETAAEHRFVKENNIPCTKAKIETKVEMGSERKREEVIGALKRIVEEVENDQEVAKKAEEFQRKYGTLTAEDLAITFTI